jgi:DNA topoisomerase-2
MEKLDDDMVAVMKKRVYDIAGCNSDLKVTLNGKSLAIKVRLCSILV